MFFSQFIITSPSDKCSHLSELIYVWLEHFLAKTTTAVFSLLIIILGYSHTKYHTTNKKELLTTIMSFVLDKEDSTAVLPCSVVKTSLISDQRFHDTGELTLCHGSKVWLICLPTVGKLIFHTDCNWDKACFYYFTSWESQAGMQGLF